MSGLYDLVVRLGSRESKDTIKIEHGETTVKDVEFASGSIFVEKTPLGVDLAGWKAGRDGVMELTVSEGKHEVAAHYRGWPCLDNVEVTRAQKQQLSFDFLPGSVVASSPEGPP